LDVLEAFKEIYSFGENARKNEIFRFPWGHSRSECSYGTPLEPWHGYILYTPRT